MAAQPGGHSFDPLVIGLTGSIGMGKSTITKQLSRLGVPVFDADQAVHELYAPGGEAVEPLRKVYPECITDEGTVERGMLSRIVLADSSALKVLESIVHPLVIAKRQNFLDQAKRDHALMVVYDIPLLLEKRANYVVDYVVVVTASSETQRARVLARPGMSEEKFAAILSKQLPDEEKVKAADYVISTDFEGFTEARAQLAQVLGQILTKESARLQQWQQLGAQSTQLDAVVFDLDDTLVPLMPAMNRANAALHAHLLHHMPHTHGRIFGQDKRLMGLMKEKRAQNGLIEHDLVELRRSVLRDEAALGGEERHVDDAMEVFLQARTVAKGDLYSDALDGLEYLRSLGASCHVLTNGGHPASFSSGRHPLQPHIELFVTPADVGVKKPHLLAFLPLALRLKTFPSHVLFVGDCYDRDVTGAKLAGMHTMWLRRDAGPVEPDQYPMADAIVPDLTPETLRRVVPQLFEGLG